MKASILKKITVSIAAIFATTFAVAGTANAIGEGQIAGGNIYKVRNVTNGGDYGDPISAGKCETLKYSLRFHNPGPSPVTNVNVKVSLPTSASTTNVSTATINSQNSDPATVSDTATVNLTSSLKINYIPGSSKLLDSKGAELQTLSDQLVNGSGVNIGEVKVSLDQIKFVQFQAKTDCPETPPCKDNPNTPEDECNPCKDNPNTSENECKPCKDNPNTSENECAPCKDNPKTPMNECKPTTPETPSTPGKGPTELVNTGPGSVAAIFAAVTAAGTFLHRRFLTGRL